MEEPRYIELSMDGTLNERGLRLTDEGIAKLKELEDKDCDDLTYYLLHNNIIEENMVDKDGVRFIPIGESMNERGAKLAQEMADGFEKLEQQEKDNV